MVAIHLRRLQPRNWQLHRAGPGTFLAGGGVDERARQGRGKGRCSATTDEAVPDEPSEVIVSKVTNTTAHISWTMPLHVNGAIKSWEVTLRGDTDNEETENDVEGEMMFFDATDLTPSTNYEVTVKCQTGGGLSKGTRRSFKTLNADNTGDNQPNIGLIIGLSVGGGIIVAAAGGRKHRLFPEGIMETLEEFMVMMGESVESSKQEFNHENTEKSSRRRMRLYREDNGFVLQKLAFPEDREGNVRIFG
nr:ephrin type-A receptor 5-like [Penaeus vannamei]